MRESKHREHIAHSDAHLFPRNRPILKRVGDLILDAIDHKLGFRILKDKSNQCAHSRRTGRDRINVVDAYAALDCSAREMRNETVQTAQQSGFARSRRSHNQDKRTRLDLKRDIPQCRSRGIGICVGEMLDPDH